ncbi:NepR family anti-sigma factor [Roseicyclus elongatus]|uniref:NepR family anti-sigma factor n=1 Tax=Roseicyclus elongatus TaxID=159346 RepID=UPI00046D0156|nr:NepR family anti-sigma factor [Roseibacterium elongatum]
MAEKRTKSKVDEQIDENLKRVYDDVLNEAVPDRFLDLIAQLKSANTASERKPDGKDGDDA